VHIISAALSTTFYALNVMEGIYGKFKKVSDNSGDFIVCGVT